VTRGWAAVGVTAIIGLMSCSTEASRSQPEARPASGARVASVDAYRARGIVAIIEPGPDGTSFETRFRLNKKLPRRNGEYIADPVLGGAGADSQPVPFGRRSAYCYVVAIGNDFDAPGLRGAKAGSRVSFRLRIGHEVLRSTVVLMTIRNADVASLGCGHR